MDAMLPEKDLQLHEAFGVILSIESFSDYISDIAELIYNSNIDRKSLQNVLSEHGIVSIDAIKEELLDLLIVYINLALNDHAISESEKYNISLLKKLFNIKEGDFFKFRLEEIKEILTRQFERMYNDNLIDQEESLYTVFLQGIFDLSYDQIDKIKEEQVRIALIRGADISNLDTARFPKMGSFNGFTQDRTITQQVKDLVWNRDNGQCRECGSKEKLEFDHIIPFSKGGSNTYRNIQLLCEKCNRKKSNKIG